MCRRTLEGVCSHHLGKVRNLSQSLKDLHSKQVIDDRLYEWATALRDDGNLAAHDISARISHEDAEDLVDFSRLFSIMCLSFVTGSWSIKVGVRSEE